MYLSSIYLSQYSKTQLYFPNFRTDVAVSPIMPMKLFLRASMRYSPILFIAICLYLCFSFFLFKHLTIQSTSNGRSLLPPGMYPWLYPTAHIIIGYETSIHARQFSPVLEHPRPQAHLNTQVKWPNDYNGRGRFISVIMVIKSISASLLGTEPKVHPEVAFDARPTHSLWIRWQGGRKCVSCNSRKSWHLSFSNG